MSRDTSLSTKVAVLTGLTVLVGGAEISGADAATIFQTQSFLELLPNQTPAQLAYNLFNPSQGTLTDVHIVLASGVFAPINSFNTTASITLPSTTINYPGSGTTFNADLHEPIGSYQGIGQFSATQNFAFNCEGPCTSAEGWSGHLDITYTYDPTAAQTPLPAALPLLATGVAGLGVIGAVRRKRKAKKQV